MVIAGTINRVAFYCRVNHRDRDYEKYLDDVMRRLEEEYGKQKWDLQIFFEEASGADPNRKEFNRLKAEIAAKKIDVVVTMRAATIARNWGQFMEFMLCCYYDRNTLTLPRRLYGNTNRRSVLPSYYSFSVA